MDPIKEAFSKVKEEMTQLKSEIFSLKSKLEAIETLLKENALSQQKQHLFIENTAQNNSPADNPTHFTALPQEIKGSKSQNFSFSTGNKGVPTDKPTDRQTNQQTGIPAQNLSFFQDFLPKKTLSSPMEELKKAQDLLDSLDSIKKEIRLKFKSLTNREMLLYTTIYSLEEQGFEEISYKILAQYLNLTESSIRDYTNKIISKNVPLLKIKQNNKQVLLKIPDDFKKVISLPTLLKLREI